MLSSVLSLALAVILILGACWIILWAIKQFIGIPAQIEKIVWVVALIICLIKVAMWLGV